MERPKLSDLIMVDDQYEPNDVFVIVHSIFQYFNTGGCKNVILRQ